MAGLIAPEIKKKEVVKETSYKTDKLNVQDIQGTNTDTYGKHKKIQGRNYMDISDIEKTQPKTLKQNRITNIPDYKINAGDVAE